MAKGELRMCKERKRIESELEITKTEIWQDAPYTAVGIIAYRRGSMRAAYGFSKVLPWEEWNEELGVTIARGRAVSKIARRIMKEQLSKERAAFVAAFSPVVAGLYKEASPDDEQRRGIMIHNL